MMDALTPEEFAHTMRSTRRSYAKAIEALEAKVSTHEAFSERRNRGEESTLLKFFRAALTYMQENPEQFV